MSAGGTVMVHDGERWVVEQPHPYFALAAWSRDEVPLGGVEPTSDRQLGRIKSVGLPEPATITVGQPWNPLDAMCHHKDAHPSEWTEPKPSAAFDAPRGIDVVREINHRLGLPRG